MRRAQTPEYRQSRYLAIKAGVWQFRAPVPKAQESPRPRDLCWVAGFLEGEGSFIWDKSLRSRGEIVSAGQVDPEPLDRVQRFLGGRVSFSAYADMHVWKITGRRARGVMMTLYGLLSARRQGQIRHALRREERVARVGAPGGPFAP